MKRLFPPQALHDPRPLTAPLRPQRRSGPAPCPAHPDPAGQSRPLPPQTGQSQPLPPWAGQSRPRPSARAGQSRRSAVAMATRDAARPGHGLLVQARGPHGELAGGGTGRGGTATRGLARLPRTGLPPLLSKSGSDARFWVLDNISPLCFANRSA